MLNSDITLPSNVAVDLVFPRNDTYNPADTFPVVFALQGASAAWTFGFFLEWRIRRAQGCEGECGIVDTGRLSVDQGEFGSVSFGNIFSVVPGASPNIREQLEDCPISGGVIGVQANLDGCPSLGTNGVEADPCVVEVPDDVISNVVAQTAASGSPEQPGVPPIPGVPLPGGPPGATTVIGYPGDDGGTQTTSVGSSATVLPSTIASPTPDDTTPTPAVPTTGWGSTSPSGIRSSASASGQTSASPTTVVVSESANDNKERLCQVAFVAMLSTLGVYML
ncbi:hypothetical protein INS49_004394 [Diaporthe citri]|uniref:uncharacterized protein n=1 Tax=Diaporthe citri TaxID=83186 RepID=UPI001C7E3DC0|nr:uncharacterized protein INS49_004394 [Diaporthe citri]KAG6354377.1 hypothetical protein INS49_004394 [Diaporthe citri]